MEKIRIQKLLSSNGIASRRKIEEYIKDGKIYVNGKKAELGEKVDISDEIILNGKKLELQDIESVEKETYILNKPVGYITTVKDHRNRPKVVDLIKTKTRIVPVGRLDKDTSGLILLTNDGEFLNLIAHPRNEIKKTYIVEVSGKVDNNVLEQLRNGVYIDGKITAKADVSIVKEFEDIIKEDSKNTLIKITIHEGRNRQVRKMMRAVKLKVISLKRTNIEFLNLKGLKEGEYRKIDIKEKERLKKIANNK